jgi:general nucleoside transport system ATP-binding protein
VKGIFFNWELPNPSGKNIVVSKRRRTSMDDGDKLLETRHLSKTFGDVLANDDISFSIRRGEIHCLLGENGAGKSTFAECLYGFYHPDSGEIYLECEEARINSPSDAIKLGIGMVHQHFILVQPLTVLENIVVGTSDADLILNLSKTRRKLERICNEYGIDIDLSAQIRQLSVGEQQWVEILKALFGGVKLLILDEPTAVLTPQEAERLFVILRQMKQDGISVIFITHKLREVMEVSDRVTVFRKGRIEGTVNTTDTSRRKLARMMVGREVDFGVEKKPAQSGDVILQVENLEVNSDRGQQAVNGISLQIKQGEIIGVAGVSGNGQRELFEAIIGIRTPEGGEIILDQEHIHNLDPWAIASRGVAHIPEDRLSEGLIPDFSVSENLILGLHHDQFFWRGIYLNSGEVDQFADKSIDEFGIVTPSREQITSCLSGGNIQRVILARELAAQPKVLIASQPTRGLDVGAIEYVHQRLIEQRDSGVGVLLFSEDLDEILNLADRIAVIFRGEIFKILRPEEATREGIGLLMAGVREGVR